MGDRKTIHMTEGGPSSQRFAGVTWTPGRESEVDADVADSAVEAFDYFEEGPAPEEDEDAEEGGAVTSEDVTPDDEFDTDAWLDQDYQERADAVAAGDVDEHLDAIAEAETSDNVLDAVGERRAEVEE